MEISREQRELGLSGMRRNPTGLWWGRDPRACLDPGQKSFAHNGGLEASALCLADEGICLEMGNQERERKESPLCRGSLGLIASAWLGMNRMTGMTALLKCTSGFIGSLPAPSRWLSSLAKCSEVSGLPSDLDLVL